MKKVIVPFIAFTLLGCGSAPTRTETSKMMLKNKGSVAQAHAPVFGDCILDGFEKSHSMMTNITTRQTRRATGYRVDNLVEGHILTISADIFDDGRTELFESETAALIPTTGEQETFAECLKKYGVGVK